MTSTSVKQLSLPRAFAARRITRFGCPRGDLRATTAQNGWAVLVSASGQVDASNAGSWGRLVSEAAGAARAPGPVVVDVSDMDFLGCCAFAVLGREAQRCRCRGINLCLVSHQRAVTRAVATCGLRWVIPIHPTIEAALSLAHAASPYAPTRKPQT